MSETIYADAGNEEEELCYKPPTDFAEYAKKSVVDIEVNDSTELWLIQWANNQQPDFDGKELTLELQKDGQLGSFEDPSGKVFDVVSFDSQEPDATVFMPSPSGPEVVGKISRRVSLVHYPDPREYVVQANTLRELSGPTSMKSNLTSLKSGSKHFATPTQSSKSLRGHQTSTHSARTKSGVSELGEHSRSAKRRPQGSLAASEDRSTSDRRGSHGAATVSGSSKKKRKSEE